MLEVLFLSIGPIIFRPFRAHKIQLNESLQWQKRLNFFVEWLTSQIAMVLFLVKITTKSFHHYKLQHKTRTINYTQPIEKWRSDNPCTIKLQCFDMETTTRLMSNNKKTEARSSLIGGSSSISFPSFHAWLFLPLYKENLKRSKKLSCNSFRKGPSEALIHSGSTLRICHDSRARDEFTNRTFLAKMVMLTFRRLQTFC